MRIEMVEKRNGTFDKFDPSKIKSAIRKAFINNKIYIEPEKENDLDNIIQSITELALKSLYNLNVCIVHIEMIQNIVVDSIRKKGYKTIASIYDEYKNYRKEAREMYTDRVIKKINSYIDKSQWKVKENSNMQYSVQGLNLFLSSDATKEYWLNEVYNKKIRAAHGRGSLHIHDLYLLSAYCIGWDLKDLLTVGFTGVEGKISSSPAKHFRTALGQICNFLFTIQGEAAGAEAFSNFDTLLAPFVYYDNLNYKEVKENIRSFLYNMNVSTRVGFQCPFTNITMDLVCPNFMKNEPVIVGGEYKNKTYSEFQEQMDMINIAFAEVMLEGDASGQIFSFPIPTYCIDNNFDWDNPVYEPIWKMTSKYGIPYFANYVNSTLDKEDARSMCPLVKGTIIDILIKDGERIKNKTVFIEDLYDLFIDKCNRPNRTIYAKSPILNKGSYEYSLIDGVIEKYTEKVIKIKLSDGRVICGDEDHLQYSMFNNNKPKSIPLKDITLDYRLLVYKNNELKWETIESIEKDIEYNDHVYCLEVANENHLFLLANGIVTHNCRLKLDLTQLHTRGGGLFGANALTGSLGVVTVNMPRIGHISKDMTDFYKNLNKQMEIAKDSLLLKQQKVEELTEANLYPYTKFYLRSIKERTSSYWTNHFLTIGLIGMHECCLNFLKKGIDSPEGYKLSLNTLKFMNEKLIEYQNKYNKLFNLEASPAEGVCYSLYNKDRRIYPDMECFKETNKKYYTNSTNLPVNATDDMFEALDHQNELQSQYTGGTVFHLFVGESIKDPNATKNLIKKIMYNYKIPYISITPTFSICKEHGYIDGEVYTCEKCGRDTLVYSRVVGYYRPIQNWNKGKENEFYMRKTYQI